MSWYFKTIFSGSIDEYLTSLGATPEIVQFIISQGSNSQKLTNEFRKNPSLTIEQLQVLNTPQQKNIDPYLPSEKRLANNFKIELPQFSKWILVSLRKLRNGKIPPMGDLRVEDPNFPEYFQLKNKIPEIQDWIGKSNPMPDIASYSPQQSIQASDEWHKMMASQGDGVEYIPTNPSLIVYGPEWKNQEWNGWTIQKVVGKNDLEVEGNKMDHCVGSYCEEVNQENSVIFSLRDPQNNPHVTIEIGGTKDRYSSGSIKQIQGKSNSVPKDVYKTMIKEWISTNGDQAGVKKEINTFEIMEEDGNYDGVTVLGINKSIGQILQGEENEYGLKYVFDSDIETVLDNLIAAAESEIKQSRSRYRDSEYYGDITDSDTPVINLALMEDLQLQTWPEKGRVWDTLEKMPKKTEWKNISTVEQWAWKTMDEVTEDFNAWDTGLKYPNEEDFETTEEYDNAMKEFEEGESSIYDEWAGQSLKGGFAKDLLKELKFLRTRNIIPSSEELYAMKKKKEEQKLINSPTYQNAYQKAQNMVNQNVASGNNWYKYAQGIDLKYVGHNSYGEFRVLMNGKPMTFYDVSPFWANKLIWMIEKSKIPGTVIYNKHLKKFSDPQRFKDLNPPAAGTHKKPRQGMLPFMNASNWFSKRVYAQVWETGRDGSFENNLKAMSELEYKRHILKSYNFTGHPKRRNNIIKKIEQELEYVISDLKEPLERTFEAWLRSHALTDPSTWDQRRGDPYDMGENDYVNSIGEKEALEQVIYEYVQYKNNNNPQRGYNSERELSQMIQHSPDMPSLEKLKDIYIQEEKGRYLDELSYEGFEAFGENQTGEPFLSEEAAEQWIEQQTENSTIDDYIYGNGIESFISSLQYSGISLSDFIHDLNQYVVFPLWMSYWRGMGIEGTRELVQEAYNMLASASSLQDNIVAINHAIDVEHQNGKIMEYMESYAGLEDFSMSSTQSMMDAISNGEFVDEWNQELQQIGSSISKLAVPDRV